MMTGQLWGGPGHGEPVSAEVPVFRCEVERKLWLDGGYRPPSVMEISGVYSWNPQQQRFDWKGPGADGDTIERLRLQ
jgi:hypothetical protein